MKISLFIPCYIDQLYPQVGMSTVKLLEKLGHQVDYPEAQTCCGQPLFNSGAVQDCQSIASHFIDVFKNHDTIVCPSGSCTSMVRNHYSHILDSSPELTSLQANVLELTEFLIQQANIPDLKMKFPHRVGILQSCHGLRELETGNPSELMIQRPSYLHQLLDMVEGIEVMRLSRPDECCGFGGAFSVMEEAVSCSMGNDRISDVEATGAEYLVGGDTSCLMHLDGLISRQRKPMKIRHIAELLAGDAI